MKVRGKEVACDEKENKVQPQFQLYSISINGLA
jgi:hypothetical protein